MLRTLKVTKQLFGFLNIFLNFNTSVSQIFNKKKKRQKWCVHEKLLYICQIPMRHCISTYMYAFDRAFYISKNLREIA